MPTPSQTLQGFRPSLSGCFEDFGTMTDRMGYIGLKVLPVFEVAKPSGTFGRIPLSQLLQNRDTLRAPGSGYARGSWTFKPESFATQENGAEEPVDDREAQMYSDYFDALAVSVERANHAVAIALEKRIAAKVFNAGTFTPTAVTNEWDDVQSATPITDFETAANAMWAETGLWPNALIINRKVYRNLRKCDQIIEQLKYTFPTLQGNIGIQQIAAAFDVPYVLVAGGAKNTENDPQDGAIDHIWSSEYAGVARICDSNDIRTPGLGRTFHWGEDGSTIGGTVETYRSEEVRSNIVRVRMDTDEKIIYGGCMKLLSNITT